MHPGAGHAALRMRHRVPRGEATACRRWRQRSRRTSSWACPGSPAFRKTVRPSSTRTPQQPCPWMPFGTVNQGSEFTVTWSSGHARGRIVYSLVLGAAIRDDQYATEHGPIGSDRSRESQESIVGRCRCSVRHAPPKPYVCQRQVQTVRQRQLGIDLPVSHRHDISGHTPSPRRGRWVLHREWLDLPCTRESVTQHLKGDFCSDQTLQAHSSWLPGRPVQSHPPWATDVSRTELHMLHWHTS